MEDELFEWRWVGGMGRAMTEWKISGVPIILNFEDGKGIEVQLTVETKEGL